MSWQNSYKSEFHLLLMNYFRLQSFIFPFRIGVSYLRILFHIINSIIASTLLFKFFLLSDSSHAFQSHGILGFQSSYWKLCSCLSKYLTNGDFMGLKLSSIVSSIATSVSPRPSILCSGKSIVIYTNLIGWASWNTPLWEHQEAFSVAWDGGNVVVKQLYPWWHISAREILDRVPL